MRKREIQICRDQISRNGINLTGEAVAGTADLIFPLNIPDQLVRVRRIGIPRAKLSIGDVSILEYREQCPQLRHSFFLCDFG
ncbi:hypothetical protein D3C73_1313990 [compost metagenome]